MLKGLLGRAKSVLDTAPTEEPIQNTDAPRQFFQTLDLIVVPRSAMDAREKNPHALVEAVVDYVNFLFQEALFTRFEVPEEAIQLYHCDYYLAQVKNGGHSKFVARSEPVLAYAVDDVLKGLASAGAKAQLGLAKEMADWIAKNPDAVDEQTGQPGGIAAELSALDAPFNDAEAVAPVRASLSKWIAGVEVLQVIDDHMMPRVLAGLKLLNPKRHERKAKSRIATLMNQLSNPVMLGLGMAGASAIDPSPIVSLDRGSVCEVDGESVMTWRVQTADGPYFGIADEAGAQLRDYVVSLDDSVGEHAADQEKISVGPTVSRVTNQQVQAARQICETLNVAIAIEAMISRLPEQTSADFVSVRSASPDAKGVLGVSVFVVANKGTSAFSAIVDEDGARLLVEPSHEVLVEMSRAALSSYIDDLQTA